MKCEKLKYAALTLSQSPALKSDQQNIKPSVMLTQKQAYSKYFKKL